MIASFIAPVEFEPTGVLVVVGATAVGFIAVDVAFPLTGAAADGLMAVVALLELVNAVVAVAFDTDKNSRGLEASVNRRAIREINVAKCDYGLKQ